MTQATTTTSTSGAPGPPGASATRKARKGASGDAASTGVIIAGIHEQADSVRVVLASKEPSGELRVIETRTFGADEARGSGLAAYLKTSKVERAVRVIPSSRTLCRCVPVPSDIGAMSDRNAATEALGLIAESELSSGIPAHRRAAGVISPGPSGSAEAVLCVGWPERASDADASAIPSGVKNETWAAELVALCALTKSMGGSRIAIYADRTTGSIALTMAAAEHKHENGVLNGTSKPPASPGSRTLARVLRGDNTSDAAWRASVARAVAETQRSIGGVLDTTVSIGAAPQSLVLSGRSDSDRRPNQDPNWLNQFGIAHGALLAEADRDAAHSVLASLRLTAPKQRRSPIVGALEWCATPKHAAIVVGGCLALLLFWPWAVAAGRVAILSSRAGGEAALQQRLAEADRRANFYTQLKEKRWPMTKLLADVAASAPVGVTIETLSLTREQGLTIRGKADDTERVNQFARNLNDSYVFGGVSTPTIENSTTGAEFQLDGQVAAPLFSARRAFDFGSKGNTLFDRLYKTSDTAASGSTPASTDSSSGAPPSAPGRGSDEAVARPRRSDNERAAADAAAERDRSRARPPSASAIPEPLTDEAIAKMDADTAMKEWTGRKKAAAKADLDAAIKQRLLEEAEKCKARMQAARGG